MSFNQDTDATPEVIQACSEIRTQYRSGQITFTVAIDKLNDMLKEAKKSRHVANQGRIHNIMGILYSLQGKLTESLNSYRQALHLAKIVNNHQQTATINMNMGEIYRRKGDYKEALKLYNQAYAISKDLTEWSVVPAGSLLNMGETLYQLGQYNEALEKIREALHRIETTWSPDATMLPLALNEAHTYLGHIYLHFGNLKDAVEAANVAYHNAELSSDIQGFGLAHRLFAEIFTQHPDAVIDCTPDHDPDVHYGKAIEYFKEINIAAELGRTYFMQAESKRKRGIKQGTDEAYMEAVAIFGRLGMSGQLNATLDARAKYALQK